MNIFYWCLLLQVSIFCQKKEAIIPFTFHEHKIIIEGLINGVPRHFIVDTGAPSFIRKSKMNDSMKVFHQLQFDALQIDSFKFLINTYDFESDKFEHIYGVLGYDFLYRYNLLIDWDEEVLVLNDRGAPEQNRIVSLAKYTLPFHFQDNSPPKLTLQINNFMIQPGISFDTGSGGGILLDNSYYEFFSKKVDSSTISKIEFSYTDVNGKYSGLHKTIVFDSLKIGNLKLENETVIFNETHAIIGLKHFLEYNIEINWDSNAIYLFKRAE